jgi:hypothetical protein
MKSSLLIHPILVQFQKTLNFRSSVSKARTNGFLAVKCWSNIYIYIFTKAVYMKPGQLEAAGSLEPSGALIVYYCIYD